MHACSRQRGSVRCLCSKRTSVWLAGCSRRITWRRSKWTVRAFLYLRTFSLADQCCRRLGPQCLACMFAEAGTCATACVRAYVRAAFVHCATNRRVLGVAVAASDRSGRPAAPRVQHADGHPFRHDQPALWRAARRVHRGIRRWRRHDRFAPKAACATVRSVAAVPSERWSIPPACKSCA